MNDVHPNGDTAPVRILVVDDHPFFREGVATWMSRQPGLQPCGHAESPSAALVAIETTKPDLVLLDLQLRNGDGFDVLRGIQVCMHQPPVIVVSHKDEMIFAERALRAGASGYVLKEEASDTMLTAIHAVMRGGTHLSAAVKRRLVEGPPTSAPTPEEGLRSLYPREKQVLRGLGRGRTTKEIAKDLEISVKTVEYYRESAKKKLGQPDSVSLVRLAILWEHDGKLAE